MSLPINHEMLLSIREAAEYSNFCSICRNEVTGKTHGF